MTKPQLEHILRAAGAITGADEFVAIGSQAILGQFPNAPAELLYSNEIDLFSLRSDVGYVRALLKHRLIDLSVVRERLARTELDSAVRRQAERMLGGLEAQP